MICPSSTRLAVNVEERSHGKDLSNWIDRFVGSVIASVQGLKWIHVETETLEIERVDERWACAMLSQT